MYDNIWMQGKAEEEKTVTVLGYLSGNVGLVYLFKFIDRWFLSENEGCYEKIYQRVIEQYKVQVDIDELIRVAPVAGPNFIDLATALTYLEAYKKRQDLTTDPSTKC